MDSFIINNILFLDDKPSSPKCRGKTNKKIHFTPLLHTWVCIFFSFNLKHNILKVISPVHKKFTPNTFLFIGFNFK